VTYTFGCHGYNFDVASGEDAWGQYEVWQQFSPGVFKAFHWQSTTSIWNAWKAGHWNTYYWAWVKAIEASDRFASYLTTFNGDINIICHSLGSRVVLEALTKIPIDHVNKVLIFNGADSVAHATACVKHTNAKIFSVRTREDRVLGYMGATFTPKLGREPVIGYHGLEDKLPNWTGIELYEEADKFGSIGDHDWSFRNPDLHEKWRGILNAP